MNNPAKPVVGVFDRWQRRHRVPAAAYGVVKKFGDDNANLLVVSLAWYGFTAIFPLLLVVVTVLGFIGEKSLGGTFVSTLHQFPVIGDSFNPASSERLHGSTVGLVVGLLGLLYGAQGVTQNAQLAMATVWDVPALERAGFLPRLGRSFSALITIGGAFLINAVLTTYVIRPGENYAIRVPVLAGLLVLNAALYWATFILLTPKKIKPVPLVPGAILGGVAFTLLITVGTGLLTHQLKNTSSTYGAFGSVIGIVAFLLLLAKLSIYAAELNPVLHRELYPRTLPMGELTDADRRVHTALINEQRRSVDESIDIRIVPAPPTVDGSMPGAVRSDCSAPAPTRPTSRLPGLAFGLVVVGIVVSALRSRRDQAASIGTRDGG
jgi:uncharacterized BrkB/YihY/UPF0761 family membrane protein